MRMVSASRAAAVGIDPTQLKEYPRG